MDEISYTEALENLASTMETVCSRHTPIMITRDAADPVVMLSLEDFEDFEEKAFLLRSPAIAEQLLGALRGLESIREPGKARNHNS